jgi:hypothetical protein
MIAPPRTAEAILEALGAEANFRDALLGDLAEEFAQRAEREGAGAARRWYYRETIRTAPHLLREWWRGARMRDVSHLIGVALTSYVFVLMLIVFAAGVARGVATTAGWSPDPQAIELDRPTWMAVDLLIGVAATTLGGYIAAWLGHRAPLVSALALGTLWSSIFLLISALAGAGPAWARLVTAVVTVVGATIGGVLRVRGSRRVLAASQYDP